MTLGAICAVLAVLAAISIAGHVWFAVVEGVLGRLKRLLGRKEPGVWHALPTEQEKEGKRLS